ncbi:hypothetical protein [Pantoea sp. SM3]|uniref:hypothetical protein n=1 Tax=Pantoea sp. SM3 TaxID=1628192 RepID=UPI0005F78049|nr:hypothetical protein [Pantoea sp. SM3]KJV27312.1 hypothetical protein VI01_19675 [Pantoea sp. SM3]
MNLEFLLGRKSFSHEKDIIKSISQFEKFQPNELLGKVNSLLIFKSETQQCWLIFTSLRMYFVIDDIDKGLIKVLWAREREKAISNGMINVHLKEESLSKETGKLYFGKMNNSILFTKSLFKNSSISGKVASLLKEHFLD